MEATNKEYMYTYFRRGIMYVTPNVNLAYERSDRDGEVYEIEVHD